MSFPVLEPTLWRTCRVLAGRVRIQILLELSRREPLTVTAVAEHLQLTLPVASQSLRALESRGILVSCRSARRVEYRWQSQLASEGEPSLAVAVRSTLRNDQQSGETIFHLATAFTHPRRIEIYRTLKDATLTWPQLLTKTGISMPALMRHVGKLERRGFVRSGVECCEACEPRLMLGRVLGRMAAA